MSEIPSTNELMIAEIYGWKWDGRYDTDNHVIPAITELLEERNDIAQFCEKMRDFYYDTDEGYGPQSWRDFRYNVVQEYFTDEFDRGEIFEMAGEKIEKYQSKFNGADTQLDTERDTK